MTGYPDDNPPTLMPFPASPAAYTSGSPAILSTGGTVDLHDYADGKIHLLACCRSVVWVRNIDPANVNTVTFTIRLLKGLDANSGALSLAATSMILPWSTSATVWTPQPFYLEAPTPLVFKAASSAGVQKLQYVVSVSDATKQDVRGSVTFVSWPIN